jgi:ABC-type transport system involved in multi-copper enzyme maturation permease subunit
MVLPTLIAREMRSAARQPFTYYLRVLAAAALVAVLAIMAVEKGGEMDRGGQVFARLHATLLVTMWVLVPMMTADCVSRERREGTLAILFLTPLKPKHIILAKGMAHGLRALTLWLAVLPVLAVPFIVGGVSWREAMLSVLLSFGSICLAMAAGLLASAAARVATRALALAAALGFLLFYLFVLELGFLASGAGVRLPFAWAVPGPGDHWAVFGFGLDLVLDAGACWQNLLGGTLQPWLVRAGYVSPVAPLGTNLPLLINVGIVGLSALIGTILLIKLAAWHLSRAWREEPPSERVVRIRQRLCTPLYFQPLFHRWMRWELNHNPIGWLEQRTWSARLVTWSWFAVFICVYSSLLSNLWVYQRAFHVIQTLLACLLVLSVAISSARSFHRERESGLLELLLVSPLLESQIINGRVRGLWSQFMPSIVLLLGLWIYFATFLAQGQNELPSVSFYGTLLLTLPIVGLYQSLARANFFSAFLSTLLLGVVLPSILARIGDFLDFVLWAFGQPNTLFQTGRNTSFVAIPFQCLLAAACAWRLHRNLKRRQFALDR